MAGVTERVAVVLLNLGGPDSQAAVKPFLYNFFTDANIIGLPFPLRHLLARLISIRRSKKEAGSAYSLLGWRSPLLENTRAQAAALEQALNPIFPPPASLREGRSMGEGPLGNRAEESHPSPSNSPSGEEAGKGEPHYKCFVCMRYWHPMADDIVQEVKAWGADRVILLPLYPQYSTTTSRSSFQSWDEAARRVKFECPVSAVCCYPQEKGYIETSADHIRTALAAAAIEIESRGLKPLRLLFSAHGLPEKIIKSGDPYQWQCEQSAHSIVERLALPDLDWQICYQSRVGPMKWIGPSTIEALEQAARDQVPVLIYPHAFVSEHVETLVEIEIEYRHLAEKLGVPYFGRVGTVSTNTAFIDGLKAIVLAQMQSGIHSVTGQRICPMTCGRCAYVDKVLQAALPS
jgi:ferrochelatase